MASRRASSTRHARAGPAPSTIQNRRLTRRAERRIAAMGPSPSAPITGRGDEEPRHHREREDPEAEDRDDLEHVHEHAGDEQRPGARQRCRAGAAPSVRSWPTCQAETSRAMAAATKTSAIIGPTWSTSVAPRRWCRPCRRTGTRCRSATRASSDVEPLGAAVEPRAERLDGHDEDRGEPDDRGRGPLQDRRSRRRGCPTPSSAPAGGRPGGRCAAGRPARPGAPAGGGAPSAAEHRGRPSPRPRSTGPARASGGAPAATLGRWRATRRAPTATASPTSTTTGTATSPTSTACTRPAGRARRRGRRRSGARAGIGSGRLALPLAARGVEVHGIDASPAMLERLRAKPGSDALTLTEGDMADLDLGRPAAVRRRVRRLQHLLQPRLAPRQQRRCLERVADAARARRAVRARGVRARRRRRRARRRRR